MEDIVAKAGREIRTYERVGLRTAQELCAEIERLREELSERDAAISFLIKTRTRLEAARKAQRAEIERLTKRLNQIASIAHAGGGSLTEGDALVELRRLSLPYWEGAAIAAKEVTP